MWQLLVICRVDFGKLESTKPVGIILFLIN